MARVGFVLVAVLVLGLAGGGLGAKQPNFLFLICDSMVSDMIGEGFMGGGWVHGFIVGGGGGGGVRE